MCYTRTMIKFVTWPTRVVLSAAIGVALDLVLGKEDPVEYVSMTNAR
jgi:hypothetical protein